MAEIHSEARVSSEAELAADVQIGPFAVVEAGVRLGAGCVLAAHAIVRSGSELAENVFVDSFAVVGGLPQDFKFDPRIPSGVRIGVGSQLREHVTVHRSTVEGAMTEIGEKVFLMAGAHVAHDCVVGNQSVVANNVLLAGRVHIGERAFLGGGAVIHQFVRIGDFVMMSGNAAISRDVPPFVTVANRNTVYGLNLVGLRRNGYSREDIADIKQCYRRVFMQVGTPARLADEALRESLARTQSGKRFLEFFSTQTTRRYVVARTQGGEDV